ncbi:MAG: RibD family protein [Haliscomenobacter sp.]|nr:RibD family protein [Haliscomenobacter sp.]MBK7476288.1 RibD family protein [Haliscomenobacter sp.]MBK8879153.1 RibD family protein [Haliscomenobacter sp.]
MSLITDEKRLWPVLLAWAKEASRFRGIFERAFLCMDGRLSFSLEERGDASTDIEVIRDSSCPPVSPKGAAVYALEGMAKAFLLKKGALSGQETRFLELYLPYIFLAQHAQVKGRAIAVGHLAQTLDGRIATESGHSQWIGNASNLDHAHRMRALCDSILIGRGTLETDQPQLTVRRTSGSNPIRIVVGSRIVDLSSLQLASEEKILVFSEHAPTAPHPAVQTVLLPGGERNCLFILDRLFHLGIHSVWVEGGAVTLSRFLQEQLLDVIQLHIAPILLGSGKVGIQLEPVHRIPQALTFVSSTYFMLEDEMMFCGQVNYKSPA